MESKITNFSLSHPKLVTALMLGSALFLAVLALLPSISPKTFHFLSPVAVDTDPENMLPQDEAVRVFNREMKKRFSLYDIIVVGVEDPTHPEGVFNKSALANVYQLAEYAKSIRWSDPNDPAQVQGVVAPDLIAPQTVDNIEQGGLGSVRFEKLMPGPPKSEAEAIAIREKAQKLPFLNDTLVSGDGRALALYVPITSKDISHEVSEKLQEKIDSLSGSENYYITGLPVAQDTFGVEMFKQMAISAPLAMLIIFLIMLYFFKKPVLIAAPLFVAFICVISTMGLLVVSGNTIHIMSSMIPIFIMPIAVLDAIHILSDFFDRYQETRDRKRTVQHVMKELFTPMLYTSLTTIAGFGSLALTPIPPVQVFGVFVALGVLLAWLWTITFIPAAIMLLPERSLNNFGRLADEGKDTGFSNLLVGAGRVVTSRSRAVLVLTLGFALVAAYGVTRIKINDNPTRWFESEHPIRVADRMLNSHFGGTYMAYLALSPKKSMTREAEQSAIKEAMQAVAARFEAENFSPKETFGEFQVLLSELLERGLSGDELIEGLERGVDLRLESVPLEEAEVWDALLLEVIGAVRSGREVFKQPNVLRYISELQEHLLTIGVVGKSNSIADIVKTVHRELFVGDVKAFRIPDTNQAVAQTLITFQNSHRPDDLWHFVTPDYGTASIWLQLKSGDNRDMSKVVSSVESYIENNPPPIELSHDWFGQTYINVVWQDRMVSGMFKAFMGSFVIVLLMMSALFRSVLWGVLAMIPLTLTILLIYGVTGLIGKDYDMPVAVLSSLSLGLAIDYAIHFLVRGRALRSHYSGWRETIPAVFGEPARAIVRNVIVVGVGFLPLLAAPLVPYQTVGIFIAAILFAAGVASLLILPALIDVLAKRLF